MLKILKVKHMEVWHFGYMTFLVAFTMERSNPFPPWERWFFTCRCRSKRL